MKNSSFLVVFEQIAKASAFGKYRILNKFTHFLSNGSSFNSQPISWPRRARRSLSASPRVFQGRKLEPSHTGLEREAVKPR